MAIYEITHEQIREITETSFTQAGFRERADLQRFLLKQAEIIAPGTLIVPAAGRTRHPLNSREKDSFFLLVMTSRPNNFSWASIVKAEEVKALRIGEPSPW